MIVTSSPLLYFYCMHICFHHSIFTLHFFIFFFFNDTATTEIYTLSLHDALPIYFGVAHVVRVATSPLTAPGVPIGTPDYMAPEQAAGEEQLDGRADLYSLAVVTFETLTGTRPAQGSDRPTLARALRGARPELPLAVATALVAPLALQPDERPRTVAAWLAAVDRSRARPWRRWGATGVAAVAVLAGGAWSLCRTHVLGICRPASAATVAVMPFDKLRGASLPHPHLMGGIGGPA